MKTAAVIEVQPEMLPASEIFSTSWMLLCKETIRNEQRIDKLTGFNAPMKDKISPSGAA